jgi:hypothetical protein
LHSRGYASFAFDPVRATGSAAANMSGPSPVLASVRVTNTEKFSVSARDFWRHEAAACPTVRRRPGSGSLSDNRTSDNRRRLYSRPGRRRPDQSYTPRAWVILGYPAQRRWRSRPSRRCQAPGLSCPLPGPPTLVGPSLAVAISVLRFGGDHVDEFVRLVNPPGAQCPDPARPGAALRRALVSEVCFNCFIYIHIYINAYEPSIP